jgi:hypothetical protein
MNTEDLTPFNVRTRSFMELYTNTIQERIAGHSHSMVAKIPMEAYNHTNQEYCIVNRSVEYSIAFNWSNYNENLGFIFSGIVFTIMLDYFRETTYHPTQEILGHELSLQYEPYQQWTPNFYASHKPLRTVLFPELQDVPPTGPTINESTFSNPEVAYWMNYEHYGNFKRTLAKMTQFFHHCITNKTNEIVIETICNHAQETKVLAWKMMFRIHIATNGQYHAFYGLCKHIRSSHCDITSPVDKEMIDYWFKPQLRVKNIEPQYRDNSRFFTPSIHFHIWDNNRFYLEGAFGRLVPVADDDWINYSNNGHPKKQRKISWR